MLQSLDSACCSSAICLFNELLCSCLEALSLCVTLLNNCEQRSEHFADALLHLQGLAVESGRVN